jgi:DNA-directed RNA polymerase subunit K/omega
MFDVTLLSQAMEKNPKKFVVANLVTIRIRQLMSGADPLVDPTDKKLVDIALQEVCEGLIELSKSDIATTSELFQVDVKDLPDVSASDE